MDVFYFLLFFVVGGVLTWVIATLLMKSKTVSKKEFEAVTERNTSLNTELIVAQQKLTSKEEDEAELKIEIVRYKEKIENFQNEIQEFERNLSNTAAQLNAAHETIKKQSEDIGSYKLELRSKTDEFNETNKLLAASTADFNALKEKLETQKSEMETLRKQFNLEFENIAEKILDEKTHKFTKINQENMDILLKPLGENIESFKKKVEEVYITEAKERFSLGEEVKKLKELNTKLSEEAVNLTNALKGSSKTQGDWGQMILENILEKSGLTRDREYFVQEFLKDVDGGYLINEDGSRMQPDVIISYPDDRKVIIDSKVSLSAYVRYTQSDDITEQKGFIREHLRSMRKHIDDLSRKSYQDYAVTLDFVMMFVPNEPAYMLALQHDPDIWQFAYDKKILLISPTNLIAALKLIVDLWKREYQNRNAIEIAERGAKLYDKFVGFIANLERVGRNIDQAQNAYNDAYKQLSTGNDNLVLQTQKLKDLGVKAKKELPPSLLEE
ncbi:DNA recombination protein RmuC [Petrimonas sp.]|uniref:DNA recombination protein RmuC n=1 Tax=Petrimonas sp. TaxID=2023866 RepID=UPI003F512FF2